MHPCSSATDVLHHASPRRPRPSPSSDWTDEDLLLLVRSGDASAFGEIYRRYEPEIRRFAASLLGHRHVDDLHDVVADTFTRVLGAIENGNGPVDHPDRYLMATTRTAVFAASRRRVAQAAIAERLRAEPTWTATDPTDGSDVLAALGRLPERSQRLLWATVVEGRDLGELSRELGISRNAAAALAYRHRRALRRAYLDQQAAASA